MRVYYHKPTNRFHRDTAPKGSEEVEVFLGQKFLEAQARKDAEVAAGRSGSQWEVTPEAITRAIEMAKGPTEEELRQHRKVIRNQRLAETDWVELPRARARLSPAEVAQWDAYRDALRDKDLSNDTWPDRPEKKA